MPVDLGFLCFLFEMATVSADKNIVGLLNGLARRQYFGESEITDEFLYNELFSELSEEEFEGTLKRCEGIMRNIVASDMDFNQLEAFLTSQTKKREGALTLEQAAAFMKFWRSQKNKIHESLVNKALWGNRLSDVRWRVDVKTQARHVEQINVPVAVVEMKIENKTSQNSNGGKEILQFEMDQSQITKMLNNIEDIEKRISTYTQSS